VTLNKVGRGLSPAVSIDCRMRKHALVTALIVLCGGALAAQAPQPVGSMSELMVQILYPTSDAIFYISTRTPKTDAEWVELQAKTLTLAESANLLMMPSRARARDQWLKDSKLVLDVGTAAFKAAKAKDVAALEALSDQLYESCVTCHQHFRPNYGKKPPQ
jgi:cytochrome c556